MSSAEGIEMQIPEDLKITHELVASGTVNIGGKYAVQLIDRISRLSSENRKLREALEELQNEYCNNECERHPDHTDQCKQARAALSRKESK